MAEWLVEEGIGEHRAALFDGDRILAARTDWREGLTRGLIADAVLISRAKGSSRGTARFPGGEQALVDRLPASAAEGAPLRLEVTRPALSEGKRRKLAQARPSTLPPRPAPTLAEALVADGHTVRTVRRFPGCDWDDLMAEAFAGTVAFPGGSLLLYPTPAMLLVDVDGTVPPRSLALAAIEPLGEALPRFDIGGSIGIDFPTLPSREERREVDTALDAALSDWPHERTAMNGFGFVQLVARTERPSLLHRATHQPASTAARWLLRQAEALERPGDILLTAHPLVQAQLRSDWLGELARRTGRTIRVEARDDLAIEGGHAQVVLR
jgi:hypothetical protein